MSEPESITLQAAAEQLGVHYMTAYRYVRHGRLLAAHKSGGSWMVATTDLDEFRSAKEAEPDSTENVDWAARLESRLLDGDEAGAWGVVELALAAGKEAQEVYTALLAPALESIGTRWQEGELSVAAEHLSSAIALRIIGRMGPRFSRRGRHRGTVLVTTPKGERHRMPSAMLSDLLHASGFEVLDLGVDVPPESLSPLVKAIDGLTTVCVSATNPGSDGAIRETIRTVKQATTAPILLGGYAITGREHAESLGADGWASDGPGAVLAIADLTSAR